MVDQHYILIQLKHSKNGEGIDTMQTVVYVI